jgi:hypothetical protein
MIRTLYKNPRYRNELSIPDKSVTYAYLDFCCATNAARSPGVLVVVVVAVVAVLPLLLVAPAAVPGARK